MQICKYTNIIVEHRIKTQRHQILQHISCHTPLEIICMKWQILFTSLLDTKKDTTVNCHISESINLPMYVKGC